MGLRFGVCIMKLKIVRCIKLLSVFMIKFVFVVMCLFMVRFVVLLVVWLFIFVIIVRRVISLKMRLKLLFVRVIVRRRVVSLFVIIVRCMRFGGKYVLLRGFIWVGGMMVRERRCMGLIGGVRMGSVIMGG